MSVNMFAVLQRMNEKDTANSTQTVKLSNSITSLNKVKQGGIVSIGVDTPTFNELANDTMSNPHKLRAVLMVIDHEAYEKAHAELMEEAKQ